MPQIKVLVHGASGRVGQEVIKAVCQEPGMKLVGAVDVKVSGDSIALPDGKGSIPFVTDFQSAIKNCQPDVVVDFTIAKASMPAVRIAAKNGVNMVIGPPAFPRQSLKKCKSSPKLMRWA